MEMIEISPANPTTSTPVTISLKWYGCFNDAGFTQTGYTFNTYFDRQDFCTSPAPAGTAHIPVGQLQAGTYTVVYDFLVDGVSEGSVSKSFRVNDVSAIPVLDSAGFSVLIVAFLIMAARFRHGIASRLLD